MQPGPIKQSNGSGPVLVKVIFKSVRYTNNKGLKNFRELRGKESEKVKCQYSACNCHNANYF